MNRDDLQTYLHWWRDLFVENGMGESLALGLGTLINVALLAGFIWIADLITRRILIQAIKVFSNKSRTTFDDFLVSGNFPKYLAHFIPLILLWYLEPVIFSDYPVLTTIFSRVIDVYLIFLLVLLFRSILRAIADYLRTFEKYKDKPLESYIQVFMIFAWGAGIYFIVNTLTGYHIISLTTLGAASAVLLLIFRDSILGLVASIQIAVNDIVRLGDWITFEKYGADGTVMEINLATVLVENFDKTFTTIPTYSLISDSFRNWRGMVESTGRRIKRPVYIMQNSIRFLTEEDLKRFENIELIRDYVKNRQEEIDLYNASKNVNTSLPINGRNQTNLGVFRKYLSEYLANHSAVNKDMTLMVRQLEPTEMGVPLEVYCFSKDKKWENYEYIQADIFDHILASISYFDLKVFELPSGFDLQKML